MYKCCIFDLDGTLLNTVHALAKTMNLTLQEFGLPPVTEDETKTFVGDGYQKFVDRAFQSRGADEATARKAYPVYQRFFEEHCMYRVDAYDGIRELLAHLKERGIRTAVVSNKGQEQATENVETVFGAGYFDLILGEREGIPRKPDPTGALYAAKTLGALPAECLYLGDTNTDMRTGTSAGMDTAGVTWGFRPRAELEAFHPRYLIAHPLEVLQIMGF